MDYKTHKTTEPYLKRVRKHKKPYFHKMFGKEIIIFPDVMSPKYDWSSRFYVENLPPLEGKKFLEIGCGSGVLSLFAHFKKAKKIVATDINKNAIKNTRENLEKYGVKNFQVYYSDVFSNVNGKFDVILFNAPYHGNIPKDILEYGVSDPNYRALKLFMRNSKKYLSKDGKIFLGFSNTGDVNLLHTLIIENKFFAKQIFKETKRRWTSFLYVLEPIKFQTPKQEWIYEDDEKYFNIYKEIIKTGKNLKVGSGLGYIPSFIKLFNLNVKTLDIYKNPYNLIKNEIELYDGKKIPYKNNYFDNTIITYTLHHIKNSRNYLNEIFRVTRKNVIIVEETYSNWIQKLFLIINDFIVNLKVKQKVGIHKESYFKTGELEEIFQNNGFKLLKHSKKRRKIFYVEFYIFQR